MIVAVLTFAYTLLACHACDELFALRRVMTRVIVQCAAQDRNMAPT